MSWIWAIFIFIVGFIVGRFIKPIRKAVSTFKEEVNNK